MVQRDNTDGCYLNIGRNNGQIREINQPASGSPGNLIRYPGYLFCQFRLTGTPAIMHDYFCDDAIRPNKAVSYALVKK
ncbi:hypothetical protein EA127_21925 [Salmonella enterica subsp. diarizonae serovar 48:i:z]|nr:hypothetical protein [Salmonella enterica subsp. diarizonae serovar 48:i:z]